MGQQLCIARFNALVVNVVWKVLEFRQLNISSVSTFIFDCYAIKYPMNNFQLGHGTYSNKFVSYYYHRALRLLVLHHKLIQETLQIKLPR